MDAESTAPPRRRLEGVDGLRAFAALRAVGFCPTASISFTSQVVEYSAALMLAHGASHRMTFFGLFLLLPVIFLLACTLFVIVERRSLGTRGSSGVPLLERILSFEFKPRRVSG